MGSVFSTYGNEIQIHPRMAQLMDTTVPEAIIWKTLAESLKKDGKTFWDTVNPILGNEPRQVTVCIGDEKRHASLAIKDDSNKKMIIFHIVKSMSNKCWLRPDSYVTSGSIQNYLNETALLIPIGITRMTDKNLSQLAVWFKDEKYEKINSDCVEFVKSMAEIIAKRENQTSHPDWEKVKDQILVHQQYQILRKKERLARNGWPKGRIAAVLGNVPYYNRFGQFTLILFPITLVAVIVKRRHEIAMVSGRALELIRIGYDGGIDLFLDHLSWTATGGMVLVGAVGWVIRKIIWRRK